MRLSRVILTLLIILLFAPLSIISLRAEELKTVCQYGGNLILEDLVIRKRENQVNFRVRIKNIGSTAAEDLYGKLVVSIHVRDSMKGKWRELKHWSNIDKIIPGNVISRDYTPVIANDPELRKGKFTLRAVISIRSGDVIVSRSQIERRYPEDAIIPPY